MNKARPRPFQVNSPGFAVPGYQADDFLPADPALLAAAAQDRQGTARRGLLRRLLRSSQALSGLILLTLLLLLAFILPLLIPYPYDQQIRGANNLPPLGQTAQEAELLAAGGRACPHFLGCDGLGRDYLVRLLYGARISLLVGLAASLAVLVIGALLGAIAGWLGGRVDALLMRLADLLSIVPDILVVVLLQVVLEAPLRQLLGRGAVPAALGSGLASMFITFALLYWVGMARLVRGQVLRLKQQDFVLAAQALGSNSSRIIRRHLLPNCAGEIIALACLQLPGAIFLESVLSFLGLGVAPPLASLGSLAADALGGIYTYPYRLLATALLLTLIVLAFNLLGDGLRDVLDPKTEQGAKV